MIRDLYVAMCCLVLLPSAAQADGGAIVARESVDGLETTVFAAPKPLVAGPVDLSFLVQEAESGRLIDSAELSATIVARDASGEVQQVSPSRSAADNKLLQACTLELLAGEYDVTLACHSSLGDCELKFALTVGEPPSGWTAWWPWFSWPIVPVAVYVACQLGDERRRRKLVDETLAIRLE